jgi:hypothetical protein
MESGIAIQQQDKEESRIIGALIRAGEQIDALHNNLTDLEARLAKVIRRSEESDIPAEAKIAEVTTDSTVVIKIDAITLAMNEASYRVVKLLQNLDV